MRPPTRDALRLIITCHWSRDPTETKLKNKQHSLILNIASCSAFRLINYVDGKGSDAWSTQPNLSWPKRIVAKNSCRLLLSNLRPALVPRKLLPPGSGIKLGRAELQGVSHKISAPEKYFLVDKYKYWGERASVIPSHKFSTYFSNSNAWLPAIVWWNRLSTHDGIS